MSFKKILTRPLLFAVISLWSDLFILVGRWTFRRLHRFDYCLYHIILLIDLLYVNRSFQFCFSTWTRRVIPYLRQCIGFSSNHTQALFILLFFPRFLFSHYSTSTHSTSKASSGATRKKKQNKTQTHTHKEEERKKGTLQYIIDGRDNVRCAGGWVWSVADDMKEAPILSILRWYNQWYLYYSPGNGFLLCAVAIRFAMWRAEKKLLSSGFVYDCSSFFIG